MPRIDLKHLDRLRAEPARAARWVQEHLPELPHLDARAARDAARDGAHEAADWVRAHLPARARLPDPRELRRRSAAPSASILWPTFLAAAGAGAAFWWWTSWSRGRAEAERARLATEDGAAHPETVLAHAPPPPDTPAPASDPLAPETGAEAVLAHALPPEGAKGKLKKIRAVVAPKAEEALRRNLAVQASAEPAAPKPARNGKAAL